MSTETVSHPLITEADGKGHARPAGLTWKPGSTASETDNLLAFSQPFADFRYLRDCITTRYAARLKMLSEYRPVAGAVLQALTETNDECRQRIIGDPVVRCAIDRSLAYFRFGASPEWQQQFEEILDMTLELLRAGRAVSLLNLGAKELRTEPEEHSAWIWTSERKEDVQTKVFLNIYHGYEGRRSMLVTPTDQEFQVLRRSLELLRRIIPQITHSAMEHVHLVGICDAAPEAQERTLPFTSFTTLSIPSTIFINRSVLSNCWSAAESILHEALHEKLYDFQHTHSLLRSGYSLNTSPKVHAVWNRPTGEGSQWPVCRSTFAFHVYTYLSEFFLRLTEKFPEVEPEFGPRKDFNPRVSARRCLDRAHHLSFHIRKLSQELGAAGVALVDWLTAYLQAADPNPPAPGSYLHLVLDLYEREGKQIVESKNSGDDREEKLQKMIHSEVLLAKQIASALDIPLSRPYPESAGEDAVERVKIARQWVYTLLQKVPHEKASMQITIGSETRFVGEAITDLVLKSGGAIA